MLSRYGLLPMFVLPALLPIGTELSLAQGSTNLFPQPVVYASGGQDAYSVAIADVNGDQRFDLIVANGCTSADNCANGTVSVLLGNGDGTFKSAVSYSSGGANPYKVVVADVNKDGKADLILANHSGGVGVLLGNGDGTFQSAQLYTSGIVNSVAVADVNGDGNLDLIVTKAFSDSSSSVNGAIEILLGNGDGTFQTPVAYDSGGQDAFGVATGDLNGDGKLDIAITNDGSGTIGVFLGNGDGTFQSVSTYPSGGYQPGYVQVGDLNGDHKVDIVVSNGFHDSSGGNGNVGIFFGDGDGTFQPVTTYDTGTGNPEGIALGDVNGDGTLDLIVADGYLGTIAILLGDGHGLFQAPLSFSAGSWHSNDVTTAKLSGDSYLDVFAASACADSTCTYGSVTVLENSNNSSPQFGTIAVTANVSDAAFTIVGPATFEGSGTSTVFKNAPVGQYTISFGNVKGYITPAQQTQALTSGEELTFSAAYSPILLTLSPVALSFSYQQGSGQAQTQQVLVSSNGPPISFTATAQISGSVASWLTTAPSGGTTPTTLAVSVASGLKSGTYSGMVSVASDDANNSPEQLTVALNVATGHRSGNNPIVLIVPGIFGTKLASDSMVVWLSNAVIYDTLFGPQDLQQLEYDSTGQPVTPLSVQAVTNGRDYGGFFNLYSDSDVLDYELECAWAVRLGYILDPQNCTKNFNVYNALVSTLVTNGFEYDMYPYDWRQDIGLLADGLNLKVAQLQAQYPGRSIAIVAHSMGGLIVGEMFAKYGVPSVVSNVITMGTPFLGSLHAYFELRGWDSFYPGPRLTAAESQEIGKNWTSAYELLPERQFVHLQAGGSPLIESIYDGSYSAQFPALPRSSGPYSALPIAQNVWNEERGVGIVSQAFAIVGSGLPTATEVTDISSGGSCLQAVNGDGDGQVPLLSATGSSWIQNTNVAYVKEQHSWLPENPDVLTAIIQILSGHRPKTLSSTPLGVKPSVTACLQ